MNSPAIQFPPLGSGLTVESARTELIAAKAELDAAKKRMAAAEKAVLPLIKDRLKDEGTTNLPEGLKVSTGYTRKWAQDKLATMRHDIKGEYWPFKTEYKEDKRASDVLAERFPGLWDQLRQALTLTPKKPSISIIDPEDD